MTRPTEKLVSILGSSYLQPIANLVECWLQWTYHRPNKVQSGFYEHGYAASVILLLVAMFESYVVRLRFVENARIPSSTRSATDVVFAAFPKLRHKKALIDLYVLRDSIFHNHLWEIEYSYSSSPDMLLHSAFKHSPYGDKKYLARVNPATRRTKALDVNIVPTRVDRRDVLKAFDIIWKTLLVFESGDQFTCNISNHRVRFRGKMVFLTEVFSKIRNSR